MYAAAELLIQNHWRIDCPGFALECSRCGKNMDKNHNCVENLMNMKLQLDYDIFVRETEIKELE